MLLIACPRCPAKQWQAPKQWTTSWECVRITENP
jgi:hypothetical protein